MSSSTELENNEDTVKAAISPLPEEMHVHLYPYRVEDITFRWDKGYLQFIASDTKEFDDLPSLLRKVIREELLYASEFFFCGKDLRNREIFEKYFEFDFFDEETFNRVRDFFPNKTPDFKSSPFCKYWIGSNRKIFVRMKGVQSFWSEVTKEYEHEVIYCIVTSKGDYSFEDIIKKLDKLIDKHTEKK